MVLAGDIAVVVAQDGADPNAPVEALRVHTPNVVTLAQGPGEPPHELVYRTRDCVRQLAARGRVIGTAALVARPGFNLGDVPGTAELLRAIVSSMVQVGRGHIYLHASGTERSLALSALAEAIREQVRGTGVKIVGDGARPSAAPAPASAPARAYLR